MQKFENMDVIAALEAIMHQNTAYYQSDFAYDIKMLREATRSNQPEDKLLLWLSRPSGTFCFRERDVLLKDTQAYNTWKFCGEQTHDRILAYAVELTGAANGTVQGNLYELDYQQHFQHIRDAALPVGANRLIYESGMREIGPKEHFNSRSDKYFGEFVRYEMQPRDPELLQAAIRQEQRSREPARPGDFKEHLAALHTGLIEAEAQRIAADMKRLAAPNSPDKNHFMVEVSPYFTKLASSRDTDQLLAMLPYKSLRLSSVKDRFGIYALIDKNENRDKCIFQNFNLLDTLTAYENISLALSIVGAKPSEIEQRIPQIAQALNIQDVLDKYPYQMSGGQQQRVAAARAMVTNPAIVLADEPTGALDSNSSRMLLTMLTELNERLSATILMVTHDAFSASYCNRILFIKDGQVFNELHRGTDTRKEFFTKILEVVSVLGGEQSEHL